MKYALSFVLCCYFGLISVGQNALNFDGTNDKVATTFPGVLGTANRTFEAWVNVDPAAPAANLCIMDYGTNLVGSRNTFSVAGDRGLVYISGGTSANISSPAGTVPVGSWVHVAFVLNSGTGYLYVNGSQVGTGSLTTVNTPSGANMSIGERVAGGSIPFQGSIDEVRVWNVARDSTELDDFKAVEFCTPPAGLVAYYKINEGIAGGTNTSITTTAEEVAGNNGTLTSFALTGPTSNFVSGTTLSTSDSSAQVLDGCPGFSVTVGTNTYTSTGIYVDTLIGMVTGCDSIVTTDLTILSADSITQTLSECDGFSVTVGTNIYSATGIYVDTLVGLVTGCDSIVTTDLTINSVDVSTSVSGTTITAQLGGATYTWLNCDSNNAVIAGATNQSFTATESGNYAVVVNDGLCSDTSDCVSVMTVGIDAWDMSKILLYPNPVEDVLSIQWAKAGNFSVEIYNSLGQKLLASEGSNHIDVSGLAPGTYFIEISKEGALLRQKFIKY